MLDPHFSLEVIYATDVPGIVAVDDVCVEPFGALPSCLALGVGTRTDKGIAGFQLTGFALRDYNLCIFDLIFTGVVIG